LFLTLEALMGRLVRARHENRLERILQQLAYPRVLILDELAYLPLAREEASLFFRLLVRRYERASLIVTSNKSFVDWGEVFNDQILATAFSTGYCTTPPPSTSRAIATGCARRRRPACSGASPSRPVTSRRWEPRRNPEDTNVGEQGTSYFGVFRATHVGLDSMELTVLLERMKMEHLLAQLDGICQHTAKGDLDYKGSSPRRAPRTSGYRPRPRRGTARSPATSPVWPRMGDPEWLSLGSR
jgi:hypothetical protein